MQIELFNTERYGAMAKPWKRRLKARGLQLLGSLVESESLWIGELSAMEDEARDEGCPEAFDRFMNDLEGHAFACPAISQPYACLALQAESIDSFKGCPSSDAWPSQRQDGFGAIGTP
jgi:hypothetical protein